MLIDCELCGVPRAHDPPRVVTECMTNLRELCTICKQIDFVEEELIEARINVQRLLAKRRDLSTQHNKNHHPFLRRLPTELISKILTFCTYAYTQGDDVLLSDDGYNARFPEPFPLSSICRTTRSIALKTHHLWTHIDFSFEHSNSAQRLKMAKVLLGRSGSLNLTLVLDSPKSGPYYRHAEALIREIDRHSTRWQSLVIKLPSHLISLIGRTSRNDPVPLLNLCLRQQSCSNGEKGVFRMNAYVPSPTKLILDGIDASSACIKWDTVTTLSLCYKKMPEILGILQDAPRLQVLKLTELYVVETESLPPLFHEHLRRLEIGDLFENIGTCLSKRQYAFLRLLTLPSLTHISLCQLFSPRGNDVIGEIVALVSKSQCHLRFLHLDGYFHQEDPERALAEIPSLKELEFKNSFGSSCRSDSFLKRLANAHADSQLMTGTGNATFAPNLRTLKLEFDDLERSVWEVLPKIFGPYNADATPHPLRSLVIRLTNVCKNKHPQYIPFDVGLKFISCIERGYNLQIRNIATGGDFMEESRQYHLQKERASNCDNLKE